MFKTITLTFLLYVCCNILYAQNDSFVIKDVRVFDGENSLEATDVVIKNGLIEGLGTSLDTDDLPQIDGKGHTLLPGFLNAHAHTEFVDQLNESLRFGVTTVLDMGTFPEDDQRMREAAASRKDVADFRSSGIFITPPGGHGTEYGKSAPTISSADEAEAFVAEIVSGGADYLKIVINGVRHQRSGTPTLDSATVYALVKAGHAHDKMVVAHVESEDDVRLAVHAGVDGLVHQWRDAGAKPDLAQFIASNDVFVVAGDVVIVDGFINEGPQIILKDEQLSPYLTDLSRRELSKSIDAPPGVTTQPVMAGLKSLYEADVLLLAGTDAFTGNPRVVHGASYHRLLQLFVEAGLLPQEVLAMATSKVADVFHLDDRGRIQQGLKADLILVEGDPTQNIEDTQKIAKIWRDGVEVARLP